jgi:allantoate deiminase
VVSGGARAVARCDMLGAAPYSDMPDGLYRGYLTPAHAEAQRAVAEWMDAAGMRVSLDPAANLVGRYEGESDGPPLVIGSHLDSVRDGGRYDGPLGIMLGIECVAALHAAGRRMPFGIEIYAFGDEEGSRFPAAMLTSRAVAGTLDPAALEVADGEGTTLADALATFDRSTAAAVTARHPGALAYLEAHIEQGPVLEAEGLALGTVTAIAAQRRHALTVAGRAGHAGTTSMSLRRDALAAAAAMVGEAERIARTGPADLVATVGRLEVAPGAANVVPGRVAFTLDVRAGSNALRDEAADRILAGCARIATERGVTLGVEILQDLSASPCDPALVALLDAAVAATGQPPRRLVSGAGHDAMVMAALCPTAMLFIRCRGGVSHHPDEHVEPADAEAALAAMLGFIDRLGERSRG